MQLFLYFMYLPEVTSTNLLGFFIFLNISKLLLYLYNSSIIHGSVLAKLA